MSAVHDIQTELDGTYRIKGKHIVLDDGHGYAPSVPFYLDEDILVITRRADIGRVRVAFKRVEE